MKPKFDVLIICSALNESFAEKLEKALNNAGAEVVVALDNANQAAISDSRLMLLVASAPTLRQPITQSAIESARQLGIPIVAGRIDNNPKSRPDHLNDAIWVDDKRDQFDENLAAIVAATRTQLDALAAQTAAKESAMTPNIKNVETLANSIGDHDIFISYSTKDTAQAEEVRDYFELNGLICWMAPRDIEGGDDYNTSIPDAIDSSKMVVVLLSPNAEASKWVPREVARADNKDLRIYPIVIKPVTLRKMEMVLSDYQSKNLDSDGIEAIFQRAREVVGYDQGEVPAPPPAKPSVVGDTLQDILRHLEEEPWHQHELHKAILNGATDIHAKDSRGWTVLHYLCGNGADGERQTAALRQWLTLNPDLNAVSEVMVESDRIWDLDAGSTPLHQAARYEYLIAARLLILHGANLNIENEEGKAPWHLSSDEMENLLEFFVDEQLDFPDDLKTKAAANESLKIHLKRRPYEPGYILNSVVAGADDFSLLDASGRNILHWAAWKNETELCELLLQRGADLSTTDVNGLTPLDLVRKSNAIEAEKVMLDWERTQKSKVRTQPKSVSPVKSIPKVNVLPTSVITANEELEAALESPKANKAKLMFQAIRDGATDLDAADQLGRTALHWAVSKGNIEIIDLILSKGGDVDAATHQNGETPLCFAAKSDAHEIAQKLIAHGAAVSRSNSFSLPLQLAISNNSVNVTRLLIENGANVNGKDWGYTMLHSAVMSDHVEIAQLLIEYGADVNARTDDGESLRELAKSMDSREFLKFLKEINPR